MTPKPPAPTKTTEPHLSLFGAWLDSQDFYERMQQYRHSPVTDQKGTRAIFDSLKEIIRKEAARVPVVQGDSAEGTPFVDEVRRIVRETGCDEASAKARILREAVEGAVEITADWKVKPLAEGTGHCGNREHGAERNDCYGFDPVPSEETRGTCGLCTHTLEDNNHGFDQNDAEMDGDRLVHYGRCTYCKICNPRKPVAPEAVGTKEPTSWRTEMLGDDAPGEAVGRETREPTKSNVTTFSAATEKCATRIWDMYLKGSGLDVDMAFADLCREINDAMQSELSTLTALRELDKEAFEMLNTSETEGMRLVAELRATIERLEGGRES